MGAGQVLTREIVAFKKCPTRRFGVYVANHREERNMNGWVRRMSSIGALLALAAGVGVASAQPAQGPLLPDSDTMMLTVFLKHDQSMNNVQRAELLSAAGFDEMFPPEGVEIVDHYVMMGIGQVIVMRFPPNLLRIVNLAIERGAWGAYQTEFYVTYDLRAAREFAQQSQ